MVDTESQELEWASNPPTDARPHHRDRCVPPRLGGSIGADKYWWLLVRGQESTAHTCPGGALATKTFAKDRENIHVHLKMDNRTAIAYSISIIREVRDRRLYHSQPAIYGNGAFNEGLLYRQNTSQGRTTSSQMRSPGLWVHRRSGCWSRASATECFISWDRVQ